jgi:DNA-binding MarR family transcriptional regulator
LLFEFLNSQTAIPRLPRTTVVCTTVQLLPNFVLAFMSIERDIRQEKFANEHHKMAVNVMFTSAWLYHGHASRLKKFSVTPEQFNVLRILRGSHPRNLMLADIACRMIDRSSNATRLVEKLRLKGYVQRTQCPTNRRQVDISITTRGLALLKKLDGEVDAWLESLQALSPAEAREVNRLLDKLRTTAGTKT